MTNDPAPKRKPGRPRKVEQPASAPEPQPSEPEPAEFVTWRYVGPVLCWVVTADGTFEARPNSDLT
ncbi:MAG: hypothetical protein ACREV8_00025, partial [Gammaproteobacteria bacterium]